MHVSYLGPKETGSISVIDMSKGNKLSAKAACSSSERGRTNSENALDYKGI